MSDAGPDGLHPQLQADCLVIGRFPLCRLLVMRDANYPWFILVPDRPGIVEIYQLDVVDQRQLIQESSWLAATLAEVFQADKLNIAALGNVVPQLHVHHVVRYCTDEAWPAPVWGRLPVKAHTSETLATVIAKLKQGRLPDFEFVV